MCEQEAAASHGFKAGGRSRSGACVVQMAAGLCGVVPPGTHAAVRTSMRLCVACVRHVLVIKQCIHSCGGELAVFSLVHAATDGPHWDGVCEFQSRMSGQAVLRFSTASRQRCVDPVWIVTAVPWIKCFGIWVLLCSGCSACRVCLCTTEADG